MAINRYSRRTPYEGSMYELPVELIAKTLESTQKTYDQNEELANMVRDFTIPSLAQDRERANALQKKYADEVDATVAEYSGNYAKASDKLKNLTRKIKKDFNPGGEAAAISGNYNNYNEWLKASKELVEKGKALGQDLNLASSYYMKEYKGIGEFDPIKGSYSVFNPESLTEYVDPESIIKDTYGTFKPEKHKVGYTTFENGLQTYKEVEREGITAQRLNPSFNSALMSNPKYVAYMQQKLKYSGADPAMLGKYTNAYAAQRAQDLSYMNSSDISKSERDPLFLLKEKQRLEDAADERFLQEMKAPFQYEPSIGGIVKKKSTINAEDWRATAFPISAERLGLIQPGQRSWYSDLAANLLGSSANDIASSGNALTRGLKTVLAGPLLSGPLGYYAGKVDDAREQYTKNKTLKDALSDKAFVQKTNIDPRLMGPVWQSTVNKYGTAAFQKNYGTNPVWTAEFDKQVINEYQTQENNFIFSEPVAMTIESPDARRDVLQTIAGRLANPENLMVIPVGSQTPLSANAFELTQKDLLTEDGKLITDDVQYVQPSMGYPVAGYQIHTPKGSFVVADQDIKRKAIGDELGRALNPLFFGDATISPVPIRGGSYDYIDPRTNTKQTMDVPVFVERVVEPTGNGNYQDALYLLGTVNSGGNLVPDPSNRKRTTMYEIQNLYAPQFQGALGTGQTKASGTLHSFINSVIERREKK